MKHNEIEGNELVPRTIKITKAHKKYLDEHPSINLSGYVRMKLDADIKEAK
jgi:hypothetical protein